LFVRLDESPEEGNVKEVQDTGEIFLQFLFSAYI